MAELNSFKECREFLDKGVRKANTMDRPIANNTRLIQINDSTIGIKLHDTFIVKYHDNSHLDCIDKGEDIIQFDTGGWKTVTTKERMNRFAPVSIWSERHIWYISKSWNWNENKSNPNNPTYHFEDGIFMNGNKAFKKEHGQLVELKPFSKEAEKAKRKQLRQIDSFIKNYVNKLMNGQLGTPSAGDCFMCQGESNSEWNSSRPFVIPY
jgi:hypothetical protein